MQQNLISLVRSVELALCNGSGGWDFEVGFRFWEVCGRLQHGCQIKLDKMRTVFSVCGKVFKFHDYKQIDWLHVTIYFVFFHYNFILMFEEYQNDLELDRMSTSMWFVLSVF
jgi:hypothetical protein